MSIAKRLFLAFLVLAVAAPIVTLSVSCRAEGEVGEP